MIERVIHWSVENRLLVIMATLMLIFSGIYALRQTPVDAIPDLSDVQVIVKTSYAGQSPQVVEDQVTYPISTAMMSVPGAKTVRGFSFFGDSYVYVIFDDDTDIYWARSRVLEYLGQVSGRLPKDATSELGPDATGVGWVFIYALVDKTGQHDLSQLRSIQDWFLKFELQSVPGVAEVATVGGMVKQYQVIPDPLKLQAYGMPLSHVINAIERGNQETGASVVEMAEAEYMITATGYVQSATDLASIPLGATMQGVPLQLRDVADIRIGPQMRRGVAELNGQGEVTGGIIVMRYGENARDTIANVKQKLQQLETGLPDGVEIVTVYDRSTLIDNAISHLAQKLGEELLIVALVCAFFLFHLRSALVAVISLPVGILAAFIIMHWQGINANIMSLGGIAIAIGAMTDGAIVMIENFHKHLAKTPLTRDNRWQLVARSTSEVGPALFFSLLIITVSFLPVFMLEAQEGRLFSPLAYTKTYAMAATAGLAITLVPVIMGYVIRGKIRSEAQNPVNRGLVAGYSWLLTRLLNFPKTTLLVVLLLTLMGFYPIHKLGTEFMPPLDEGDLMYMPTTYAGISVGKAREILQQTDKLIATVPEVQNVFGKVGRAETATDPAPLTMIETFIQLKPKSEWREGVTTESLRAELESLVQFPGLSNAWVMPIKTRIDMLATGMKTPVGIKVAGPDLNTIQNLGQQIEVILRALPETTSVYAERVEGGRYINIDIDRDKAARYGLNIADIQQIIASAVGGRNIGYATEGLARFPVQVRYPRSWRDSPEQLQQLPLLTPGGQQIILADVADIVLQDGPPGIKSENARINGWVYIDINSSDIKNYVAHASEKLSKELVLPPGYSITWAGQYEYIERAQQKLMLVVPLTLALIALLLYLSVRHMAEVLLILGTLPLAFTGGLWLLYWLDFSFSVAVGVGFIALAGVAVEIGVLMLLYLNQAINDGKSATSGQIHISEIQSWVLAGATRRIRPIVMTVATIVIGLLPVLVASGTGAEVMSRIAAPMIGGMISALLLSLVLLPVVFFLWKSAQLR